MDGFQRTMIKQKIINSPWGHGRHKKKLCFKCDSDGDFALNVGIINDGVEEYCTGLDEQPMEHVCCQLYTLPWSKWVLENIGCLSTFGCLPYHTVNEINLNNLCKIFHLKHCSLQLRVFGHLCKLFHLHQIVMLIVAYCSLYLGVHSHFRKSSSWFECDVVHDSIAQINLEDLDDSHIC